MARLRVRPRVGRVAVIGIDDVAGRAAGGAKIARLVVRAEEGEQRIEQPRLLQAEEDRVRAQPRAQAPIAQLDFGLARQLIRVRAADVRGQALALAPALEDAQDVAWLGYLPARQWQQ